MNRPLALIATLFVLPFYAASHATAADGLAVFASRGGRVTIEAPAGRPTDVKRFDTFTPAGQTVRVSHSGFAAIVLSNGCSIYLAPGTELTFLGFSHPHPGEGFFQRAFETGHSELKLNLIRGSIAVSHPNRRASSTIQVLADNTKINLLSAAAIIQHRGTDLEIAVIDGNAHLSSVGGQRSDTIQAGLSYITSGMDPSRGQARRITPADRRAKLALLELADTSAAMIIFDFPSVESASPPKAAIARDPSHFKKRPVNDFYLGGRNY